MILIYENFNEGKEPYRSKRHLTSILHRGALVDMLPYIVNIFYQGEFIHETYSYYINGETMVAAAAAAAAVAAAAAEEEEVVER